MGLPNVVIRRQVVSGRGPQSVRYANGVTKLSVGLPNVVIRRQVVSGRVRSLCDTRTV